MPAIPSGLLSNVELSGFCAQTAMVLKSGIPISEGVGIMLDDAKGPGLSVLSAIHDKLEAGAPLFEAMSSVGVFPAYMVSMTEIGEKTGRLDDVMDSLSSYYEREEAIRQSVRSAVTYPMVMVLIMLVVIGLLVIEVLPVFDSVFRDLGSEMTGFAQTVMGVGALISRYAFVIIGVLAAAIILFLVLRNTSAGKRMGERFRFWFPPTRNISQKIASGRFASAMSLMLSSGLDPDDSLEMVYRLADTDVLRGKIESCRKALTAGSSLAEAMLAAELFSGIYARMVAVAFKTGSVDGVMSHLAARYEDEIEGEIGGLIAVLEPTLVIILSVLVGLILLSVMLPLMGVMSSIG